MKPFNTLTIQTRSVQPAWSIRRVRMCRDSPKPRLPKIFQLFINVKFDNTICIIKMGPCLYQSRLGSFIVQITDNVSVRKMLCPQQNSNQCTQQLYKRKLDFENSQDTCPKSFWALFHWNNQGACRTKNKGPHQRSQGALHFLQMPHL